MFDETGVMQYLQKLNKTIPMLEKVCHLGIGNVKSVILSS